MTNDTDTNEDEAAMAINPAPPSFRPRPLVICVDCGRLGTREVDCFACQYDAGLL